MKAVIASLRIGLRRQAVLAADGNDIAAVAEVLNDLHQVVARHAEVFGYLMNSGTLLALTAR